MSSYLQYKMFQIKGNNASDIIRDTTNILYLEVRFHGEVNLLRTPFSSPYSSHIFIGPQRFCVRYINRELMNPNLYLGTASTSQIRYWFWIFQSQHCRRKSGTINNLCQAQEESLQRERQTEINVFRKGNVCGWRPIYI